MSELKKVAEAVYYDSLSEWISDPQRESKLDTVTIKNIEQALITHGNKIAEEAAKVAEDYHWEIRWRGEGITKTKSGVTGEEIAKAIRERLKVEG